MSIDRRSGRPGPAALFARALYRSAPAGSFVEVRFRRSDGMGRRFVEVDRLDRLVGTVLSLAARTDVFVGVVPRRRHGGGRRDLVERAGVLWVDCDSSESVEALRRFRPMPAMVVSSGSNQNRHAYWFLDEPAELDVIERVNRRLAGALDADLRCADAARILRPVGSVNRKHSPPVAVRLLRLPARECVAITELEQRLPADPSPVMAPAARRSRPTGTGADRLELIPPREYFERLTGQPVGRSGKARCPFHEDHRPSLHVYQQPGQGWYCFGCGRGGSALDLAALLWLAGQSPDAPLRGRRFIEVRDRLAAIFADGGWVPRSSNRS
jgi:hypothetical protein